MDVVDGVESCKFSTRQLSAGSSVQSAGIMVGSLIASPINNRLGRKWSLFLTAIISLIGVIIQMTSALSVPIATRDQFTQFVVGKSITSISMGLVANIVPIYLSETSPASARGFGISMYQNVQIIGVIAASGAVYATANRRNVSAYLIPIGLQAIAPSLMILSTPWIPESPRWLVWKGRMRKGAKAASKLFGSSDPNFDPVEYCQKLLVAFEEDRLNAKQAGWADLLSGPDLRRALIAIGVQCLQQAQGSSYMNNYIVPFLQDTGVKNVFPVIMGLNCLYYVSLLSGHFLPDMVGRRIVLMATSAFCGTCLLSVASITTAAGGSPPTSSMQRASIALIFLWNFGFGVQSPLIWITTAEAAPTRNRERVLASATFFGFGISLLIASVSPFIQDEDAGNLGSKIGFLWGTFSLVNLVWVYLVVPEMKGLSLEQLDYLYANNTPTRQFKGFKFTDDILARFEREQEAKEDTGGSETPNSLDEITVAKKDMGGV
ncbi:general substrate transporter [Kockovaella imperatae]|uniref:General substrate transporter n=1 Tax=Kockovaella imperatae TaxID=4999 RepID=A0A1Y1UPV7_9TREE|nr:general substrate transporter [Kockovaella imperatae]ORX40002.1 general substrate transporter [Kockovaella imperatae]